VKQNVHIKICLRGGKYCGNNIQAGLRAREYFGQRENATGR
jgi:hypothetical protein